MESKKERQPTFLAPKHAHVLNQSKIGINDIISAILDAQGVSKYPLSKADPLNYSGGKSQNTGAKGILNNYHQSHAIESQNRQVDSLATSGITTLRDVWPCELLQWNNNVYIYCKNNVTTTIGNEFLKNYS
eukprot:3944197-Ditylum_brightwellii.AAC.2